MKSFPAELAVAALLCGGFTTSMHATGPTQNHVFGPTNPFFAPSTLPYHAPPFNKIKDADYQPALEAGMAEQRKEIDAIASSSAAPTFENTFVAMERSGQLLTRVMLVFNAVTSANNNPTLQSIQEAVAAPLAAQNDYLYLNPKLFARVEAVYNQRASLHLDPESMHLIEWDYLQFVKAGARLNAADQAKLKKLNEEESVLQTAFTNKLLAATKAGAVNTKDQATLAGLSAEQLDAAKRAAEQRKEPGYTIALQNTTQQPDLTNLSDRSMRKALLEHSLMRAERGDANDTRATVSRLAQLRAQKAALLGFPNYASWALQDQMAQTPKAAIDFMDALVPAATAKARAEAKDIQALIDQQHGGFQLEASDWNFYAEQVRKAKYDLNNDELKPYFEISRVLQDGVFYAANQLYGVTFKERHDLPVYDPDVRTFECIDSNGKTLALVYFDYWKRDNKNGGAWMSNFVNQSTLLGTIPVIYNVGNFQKPAAGQPALISFEDAVTMFHEFGHGLHGIFANTIYPGLSGANTARDYVEFPSQFNEHWATYPAIFHHYAVNYKTGEPMPDALFQKLKKAQEFNKGYGSVETLAAQELDMQWHLLPADAKLEDVDAFEKQAIEKVGLALPQVPPRYRSSYFLHIWSNGYAAGYYAYLWSENLDDNAYQWFLDHGGLTRANGDRFRQMILSRGNTEPLEPMFERWLGGKPNVAPLLKQRGLTADSTAGTAN